MKVKHTNRGFAYFEFKDVHGNVCNIQKSSNGMQSCIWLGSREIGLRGFIPYVGWSDITDDQFRAKYGFQDFVANNRMQLNRKQVAKLLPILQKFVDTGDID